MFEEKVMRKKKRRK